MLKTPVRVESSEGLLELRPALAAVPGRAERPGVAGKASPTTGHLFEAVRTTVILRRAGVAGSRPACCAGAGPQPTEARAAGARRGGEERSAAVHARLSWRTIRLTPSSLAERARQRVAAARTIGPRAARIEAVDSDEADDLSSLIRPLRSIR
jgi:hypothetical protein